MKVVEADRQPLEKCPSGIPGLDEITGGGLPRGRPTLVCGGAGCGKTLFAMEFLVQGATEYGEPGVFMAFEETAEELTKNVALARLRPGRAGRAEEAARVDYVHVERSEIEETGEYDLEGLFIRLGFAIDSIGAKRVVLDTIEALFGGLSDEGVLRAELRRLFRWLKDKGVTGDHHRRAGRRDADPPRPGGVRLRLRDPARPPGHRADLHPPPAGRQVPRLEPRHQRVSRS